MRVVGLDDARNKVSMNVVQNIPIASVFPPAQWSELGRVWDPSCLDLHVNENGRVVIRAVSWLTISCQQVISWLV